MTPAPEAKPQASSDPAIKHGKAQLTLTKDLADGLTYRFTFTFEKAGEVTVAVPIDAGPNAPASTPSTAAATRVASTSTVVSRGPGTAICRPGPSRFRASLRP